MCPETKKNLENNKTQIKSIRFARSGPSLHTQLPLFLSVIYLGIWVVMGTFAYQIAPHDPNMQNLSLRFASPGTADHLLGTDSLGRDVFSRLIHGYRTAGVVGFGSLSLSLLLGSGFAVIAGFLPARGEKIFSFLNDSVLAIPTVLLSLSIIAALGPGQFQIILSLGIVFTPFLYRVILAEMRKAKAEGWVLAAQVLGTPWYRVMFWHILPQILPVVLVHVTSLFSLAVSLEASLSFLGVGSQPPQASWGLMLQEARNFLFTAGRLAVFPGLVLAISVLALNTLGDSISRIAANPRE